MADVQKTEILLRVWYYNATTEKFICSGADNLRDAYKVLDWLSEKMGDDEDGKGSSVRTK